jgi:hypothetical protein
MQIYENNQRQNETKTLTDYWAGPLTRIPLGLPSPWLDPTRASAPTAETHASVIENRWERAAPNDEL